MTPLYLGAAHGRSISFDRVVMLILVEAMTYSIHLCNHAGRKTLKQAFFSIFVDEGMSVKDLGVQSTILNVTLRAGVGLQGLRDARNPNLEGI